MGVDARYRVRRAREGWAAWRRLPGQWRWRRIGLFGLNAAPYNCFPSELSARWFCNLCRRTDERRSA